MVVSRLKGQEGSMNVTELDALSYILHSLRVILPSVRLCSILTESLKVTLLSEHMASVCVNVMCFLSL